MKKLQGIMVGLFSFLVWWAPSNAAPNIGLAQTPLNILWRVQVPRTGGTDYMTTISPGERNLFASDGQIFYVPKTNISSTGPLYRLFTGSIFDHMDSESPDEGGYSLEGIQGYPFTSSGASAGLAQIQRSYNPGTGDHATIKPGENISGYSVLQGLSRWGYPRYNHTAESILSLSAGGVTIESDAIGGGQLTRWWYAGTQFLNSQGYGRALQASFFLDDFDPPMNPTEAGDRWANDYTAYPPEFISPERSHGSPIVQFYNDYSNPTRPI